MEINIEASFDGAFDDSTQRVKINLSSLLKAIILNEGKRFPNYKKLFNFSERSIERYLQLLKKANFIEFRGDAA